MDVASRGRGRCRAIVIHAVHAAMQAPQCVGVVCAQSGVGPVTALSVAARIAKQYLDFLDPLPILAYLLRRPDGFFRQRKAVEPLARFEYGVLQLDIAPITRRIAAQQFIGARKNRAVLVRARRLHHGRRAVVADGSVEIESAVSLLHRPASVGGELSKRISKLCFISRWPCMVTVPGKSVQKLCKR